MSLIFDWWHHLFNFCFLCQLCSSARLRIPWRDTYHLFAGFSVKFSSQAVWQSAMTSLSCFAALLCVAISHSFTPVSSQDHYPPGWWDAPSSIDDFPVEQIDNKTRIIINPWEYLQRMGIFKLMVQNTQGYFKSWGYNNTGNLLWGLPLQFGWQMTSGRLCDMAEIQRCKAKSHWVSPNSWWADMNYYLSV